MAIEIGTAVRALWWLVLVRGILLVLLGVLTLWQPLPAVLVLAIVFGIYAIADGIVTIIAGITSRKTYPSWGWLITRGTLALLAGVLILLIPGVAGLIGVFALLWFLVISAVVGGAMSIMVAARSHGSAKGWGIFGGVLDILFGVLLAIVAFTSPAVTLVATVWVLAIGAIFFGVVLIFMAFQLRRGAYAGAAGVDDAIKLGA